MVAFRSHEGVSRLQRLMLETDGGFKGREEEAVEGEWRRAPDRDDPFCCSEEPEATAAELPK